MPTWAASGRCSTSSAAGFKDPILVAANDGVGTKLKIAIDTGQHATIGIDLVAMCVNDLLAQGAEPLFFLDYFACGKLDVATARSVIAGIAEGCRQAGCALIGGETAEMPGMYAESDYDLAGFAVGAVERGALLPRPDVAAGDVLIGLASSGVHSNGYSLVRRLVAEERLAWEQPAPFAPQRSLAEALLEPTRIYVKPVLAALRETQARSRRWRTSPAAACRRTCRACCRTAWPRTSTSTAWTAPAVFGWLQRAGNLDDAEMLRTFNCGVGLILVVAAGEADAVLAALAGPPASSRSSSARSSPAAASSRPPRAKARPRPCAIRADR